MSEIKLLHCPFCNGEAELKKITVVYNHDNARTDVYVRCKVCGAKSGDWVNNEVDAINKWNTRKPMQDILKKLEGMEEKALRVQNYDVSFYATGQMHKAIEIVKEVGGIDV